jgi:hypothetical protein
VRARGAPATTPHRDCTPPIYDCIVFFCSSRGLTSAVAELALPLALLVHAMPALLLLLLLLLATTAVGGSSGGGGELLWSRGECSSSF